MSFTKFAGKGRVMIVLGGPGSGKGTQCEHLTKKFGFLHLSAGQLLRDEMDKKGEYYDVINNCIVNGLIVPSHITISLLLSNIKRNMDKLVLIDGFPRNQENLEGWEKSSKDYVNTFGVLYLQCTQQSMTERIMQRAKSSGRTDDNLESLKKRFKVFEEQTQPVISYYDKLQKVIRINGDQTLEAVSDEIDLKLIPLLKSI